MTEPTYFLLVCDDIPHDVLVTDPGPEPLAVAHVVRGLTGLSLWRSKVLAMNVPAVILDGVTEEEATAAVEALRGAGAQAGTRAWPEPGFLR
jgi:large subunit ribosomal protein L7/L12